ncbi:hypothetical protein [Burkholderia sp. MSMB1589WGS]|uniref:hypothetical protein n=2 Tax=Burkholderiaceae TaxID=119060 RepID=UPI0012E93806|nr:hypothetical protein [Burkholderia sp. MSMB1589WGS]
MLIMPRKATPASVDVAPTVERIEAFCRARKISVLALANEAQVGQSSLCRFMHGERKTLTVTAERVLRYIDSWHNEHNAHSQAIMASASIDQTGRALLEQAILSLWDGELRSAQILAPLIQALKPVLDMAVTRTSNEGRGGYA